MNKIKYMSKRVIVKKSVKMLSLPLSNLEKEEKKKLFIIFPGHFLA